MKVASRSIRKKRVLTDHVCECGGCGQKTYLNLSTGKPYDFVRGHGHTVRREPVQFLPNKTVRIPLTKGYWATVDLADYPLVAGQLWFADAGKHTKTVYAGRNQFVCFRKGKRICKEVFMHHVILGVDSSNDVDHKDHDGLNNRRKNLRLGGIHGNMRNKRKLKALTSKYKGVCLRADSGRWRARILVNGKNKEVGTFRDEVEAARAYDKAALFHYGEYACTNFPKTA